MRTKRNRAQKKVVPGQKFPIATIKTRIYGGKKQLLKGALLKTK